MTTTQTRIIREAAWRIWNVARIYISYLPHCETQCEKRKMRRHIHDHRIASRRMLGLARGKHENP